MIDAAAFSYMPLRLYVLFLFVIAIDICYMSSLCRTAVIAWGLDLYFLRMSAVDT